MTTNAPITRRHFVAGSAALGAFSQAGSQTLAAQTASPESVAFADGNFTYEPLILRANQAPLPYNTIYVNDANEAWFHSESGEDTLLATGIGEAAATPTPNTVLLFDTNQQEKQQRFTAYNLPTGESLPFFFDTPYYAQSDPDAGPTWTIHNTVDNPDIHQWVDLSTLNVHSLDWVLDGKPWLHMVGIEMSRDKQTHISIVRARKEPSSDSVGSPVPITIDDWIFGLLVLEAGWEPRWIDLPQHVFPQRYSYLQPNGTIVAMPTVLNPLDDRRAQNLVLVDVSDGSLLGRTKFDGTMSVSNIKWSPAGDAFAFVVDSEIWRMAAESDWKPQQVVTIDTDDISNISFTLDPALLMVLREPGDDVFYVDILDLNNGALTPLDREVLRPRLLDTDLPVEALIVAAEDEAPDGITANVIDPRTSESLIEGGIEGISKPGISYPSRISVGDARTSVYCTSQGSILTLRTDAEDVVATWHPARSNQDSLPPEATLASSSGWLSPDEKYFVAQDPSSELGPSYVADLTAAEIVWEEIT